MNAEIHVKQQDEPDQVPIVLDNENSYEIIDNNGLAVPNMPMQEQAIYQNNFDNGLNYLEFMVASSIVTKTGRYIKRVGNST